MQVNALLWSRQFSFGRLLGGFNSSQEFSRERFLVCVWSVRKTDRRVAKGGVMTPPSNENPGSFKRTGLSRFRGSVLPQRQTLRQTAIPAVRHFADLVLL